MRFALFLALFFTATSFADGLFSNTTPDCQIPCAKIQEPTFGCECSDLGYNQNTCMDKKLYCKEFGNIGLLDD